MYINLDVVMRLVQIGLVVAGIGALITLAMLFKNLIHTLHAVTATLDELQKDLAKLEGPLTTVDELSNTVSEIQTSAKRAANTAIDSFQNSSAHLMRWIDSKTSLGEKDHSPQDKKESAPSESNNPKPEEVKAEKEAQAESKQTDSQKPQESKPVQSEKPKESEAEFKPVKPAEPKTEEEILIAETPQGEEVILETEVPVSSESSQNEQKEE